MTSSPHGLYAQGCTRATMKGVQKGMQAREGKLIPKTPCSDCRLQLACMKLESAVIAGQQHRGECVPSLVHTACQATKDRGVRSRRANRKGAAAEGETVDWD